MKVGATEQFETTQIRSSRLKYYIHDSADNFRIQLVGELERGDLAELDGCWCTAKSSLGGRKLVLDVRALKAVDEEGRQWLSKMSQHGTLYSGDPDSSDTGPSFFGTLRRIFSFGKSNRKPKLEPEPSAVQPTAHTRTVNADSVLVTGR
jgi:hypothetical protein